MDILAQKKFLIRIIVILIALNLLSLGAFLCKNVIFHPQHPPREPKDATAILKKELELTPEQFEQIKDLRTKYFDKEKIIELNIRLERDSMNTAMFNKTTDEELVKTLARKIAENEYQMELMRFGQSKEFKSICQPDQLVKFDKVVKEIRDYFKPDKQNDANKK